MTSPTHRFCSEFCRRDHHLEQRKCKKTDFVCNECGAKYTVKFKHTNSGLCDSCKSLCAKKQKEPKEYPQTSPEDERRMIDEFLAKNSNPA